MRHHVLYVAFPVLIFAACSTTVNNGTNSTSCNIDSSITGCTSNSTGYSCPVGQPAPDANNSSLLCSVPVSANGVDEYCCASNTPVSGATCEQDMSVTGCTAGSYGFACTGSDRPDTDYSGIVCSTSGTSGVDASGTPATLYCCVYNGTSTQVTCNEVYQEPAGGPVCGSTCDACLQTYECGSQYKACDSTCQSEIQAMMDCTKNAAAANNGNLTADDESACSTSNLGGTNSAAYALWWEVIRVSVNCSIPCCAVG